MINQSLLLKEWKYIAGTSGTDASVQISPDGKILLIKEYRSGTIVERTYKIVKI